MISIFIFFLLLNLKLIDATYFQQNAYRIKEDMTRTVKKNWILRLCLVALGTTVFLFEEKFIIIPLIILAFLYCGYLLFTFKVRIKFTSRMKRLLLVSLIINACLAFLEIGFFFLPISFFIIHVSSLILHPVERYVYYSYFKKCQRTICDFKGIKIGITGSYGKTSVKHFLYQILKTSYNVHYTEKSYNTPMGISKSVIGKLNDLYDIMILEMGAGRKGDIGELMDLCKPDISILTTIGPQHIDVFKTLGNIINEKFLIVEKLKDEGTAFVNADNEHITNYIKLNQLNERKNIVMVGQDDNFRFVPLESETSEMVFEIYKGEELYDVYRTSVQGYHNYYNILLSVAVADFLKVDKESIKEAVKNLKSVNNRLEIKKYPDLTIIDDGFNSNIDGALNALTHLKSYDCERWLITPGFVGLSKAAADMHHQKFAKMIDKSCDHVIIVNKVNRKYFKKYLTKKEVYYHKNFQEGMSFFYRMTANKNRVLLIENDLPDNY